MSEGVCGALNTRASSGGPVHGTYDVHRGLAVCCFPQGARSFFDFVEGGSSTEQSLAANRSDFERVKLRQRVLIDVADRSTRSTILGAPAALPLALAPVGLCGMLFRDGEILACRAAQAAGIPFCLST